MGNKNESESCSVASNSLQPHGLYGPWNSPGQNTGVGSCSLLHGIFPTQGSNWGLLHCRWILYQLSYEENCFQGQKLAKYFVELTSCFFNHWHGIPVSGISESKHKYYIKGEIFQNVFVIKFLY